MKNKKEATDFWATVRDAIPLKTFSVGGVLLGLLVVAVWNLGVERVEAAIRSSPEVVSTLWGWPMELLDERRLARIDVLRAEAAKSRFVAEKTDFAWPLPDEVRDAIRRRHFDKSVMLELKARKLESGKLVDTHVPVEMWIDHFVAYPMEVEVPGDWEPPLYGREPDGLPESP